MEYMQGCARKFGKTFGIIEDFKYSDQTSLTCFMAGGEIDAHWFAARAVRLGVKATVREDTHRGQLVSAVDGTGLISDKRVSYSVVLEK